MTAPHRSADRVAGGAAPESDSTAAGPRAGQGHSTEDPTLLGRLRSGDDGAHDELVRANASRMLAVARRMLRREDDALDAVQEAFLSAFKSIDRFDGRSQLSTWLHRITVNACLMKLRTSSRRPERLSGGAGDIDALLPAFEPDGHQTRDTPEWILEGKAGLERDEVRRLVRDRIDELPETFRTVLLLRDIEELSTEETAEALQISTNAVKTRLHRARQALRTLLEPSFVTESA